MFIFEAKPAYINRGVIKRGKTNTAVPGLISFFSSVFVMCAVSTNMRANSIRSPQERS